MPVVPLQGRSIEATRAANQRLDATSGLEQGTPGFLDVAEAAAVKFTSWGILDGLTRTGNNNPLGNDFDENYDVTQDPTLTDNDIANMSYFSRSRSPQETQRLRENLERQRGLSEILDKSSNATFIPALVVAGLIDPLSYIPLTGAASLLNRGRLVAGVAGAGTVGVASGAIELGLRPFQPDRTMEESITNVLLGIGIGGGIGLLIGRNGTVAARAVEEVAAVNRLDSSTMQAAPAQSPKIPSTNADVGPINLLKIRDIGRITEANETAINDLLNRVNFPPKQSELVKKLLAAIPKGEASARALDRRISDIIGEVNIPLTQRTLDRLSQSPFVTSASLGPINKLKQALIPRLSDADPSIIQGLPRQIDPPTPAAPAAADGVPPPPSDVPPVQLGGGSSAGSQQVIRDLPADASLLKGRFVRFAAGAIGSAGPARAPVNNLATSSSNVARNVARELVDDRFLLTGDRRLTEEWVQPRRNAETIKKRFQAETTLVFGALDTFARQAGIRARDFYQEVSNFRITGQTANPVVREANDWLVDNFYRPVSNAMIEFQRITREQIEQVGGIERYFSRTFDVQALRRNKQAFLQVVRNGLSRTAQDFVNDAELDDAALQIYNQLVNGGETNVAVYARVIGRTSNIFQDRRLTFLTDSELAPFLDTDLRNNITKIANATAGVRGLGQVARSRGWDNLEDFIEDTVRKIEDEFDQLETAAESFIPRSVRTARAAGVAGEGPITEAVIRKARVDRQRNLSAQRKAVIEDLGVVLNRLLGVPNITFSNPDTALAKMVKAAKQAGNFLLLGNAGMNSIPDFAGVTSRAGLLRTFKGSFQQLVRGFPDIRMQSRDARRLLVGSREYLQGQTRFDTLANPGQSRVHDDNLWQKAFTAAERAIMPFTLLNQLTVFAKRLGTVSMTDNLLDMTARRARGTASGGQIEQLNSMGINTDMATRIARQFDEFGTTDIGVRIANFDDWTDNEARVILTDTLFREAENFVVTPSIGDVPAIADDPNLSIFTQLKSFMYSVNNKMLLPTIQQSNSRPILTTNFFLLNAAIGSAVVYGNDILKGNDPKERTLRSWATESIDRGGTLSMFTTADDIAHKMSGGQIPHIMSEIAGEDPARYLRNDSLGSLVPSIGAAQRFAQSGEKAIKGELDPLTDNRWGHIVPLYNHLAVATMRAQLARIRDAD